MRPLVLALAVLLLSGCAGMSDVRRPTARERAQIIRDVNAVWSYESSGRPTWADAARYRRALLPPHLHPKVVSIRISPTRPLFAIAAVELWSAKGRWTPGTAVLVFKWVGTRVENVTRPWDVVAGPATRFPIACTAATAKGLRNLLCPDPWSVLGYRQPRLHPARMYSFALSSDDLHLVDWRNIPVPATACGTAQPVRLHRGTGFAHSLVYPWWSVIDVGAAWERDVVSYGDVDGDGRDEAAVAVSCGNGGGTAAGQLAYATVIFTAERNSLRVLGIIRPRQPLGPTAVAVPIVSRVHIRRRAVIAPEAWYGPEDGTCCPSGRARTIWRYSKGQLRPVRMIVERQPRG